MYETHMTSALHARIDLNLLAMFVAVADTASFTLSAKRLGLTGSSVSRGVANLERALGVRLFARTTRHVALTPAGIELRATIGPALLSIGETLDSIAQWNQRQPSGELRVTAPADLATSFFPSALISFSARYPDVRLDIRITSAMVDLVAEGIDVAVRASGTTLKDSSMVASRIHAFEWIVLASPHYLAHAGMPKRPIDAARQDWVVMQGNRARLPLDLERKPRIVSDDILFVREAVVGGLGFGFLPRFLVREQIADGRLVHILPNISVEKGGIYLVSPSGRHLPPKVHAFRQHLATHFRTTLSN